MALSCIRRTILCLLAALAGSTLPGCNQSSGFVMNESGKALYAQGHYTAARREFERALIDNPDNPDYAFNVASAMRRQGDLIGAERMYRHALNLDPRHQPSHHGLAEMYVDQGRVAEADSHLQEWADTQPYLAEAHIENAWFRRRQGDLTGAEQYLRRALQVDPKHPVAMAQLGDLYEVSGRPGEARAMYQRSLARNPFQSEVRARMTEAMQQQSMMTAPQMAGYPATGIASQSLQQTAYQMPAHGGAHHPGLQHAHYPGAGQYGFNMHPSSRHVSAFYGQPGVSVANSAAAFPQPGSLAHGLQSPATYLPAAPPGSNRFLNGDPAHVPTPSAAAPVVTPF